MSGILKRTVFIGPGGDGAVRVASWARVITGIGVCYEPRSGIGPGPAVENGNIVNFDWNDQIDKIDDVKGHNPSGPTYNDNTCGGETYPVDGY